jgi:hypothetical protein
MLPETGRLMSSVFHCRKDKDLPLVFQRVGAESGGYLGEEASILSTRGTFVWEK